MDTFPIELWRLIIKHLSTRAAINLCLTNRLFYDTFIDEIYYDHVNSDPDGYRPLRMGVYGHYHNTVKRALAQGADPNQHVAEHKGSFLALATAVARQDVPMVELLMRYGADPLEVVYHGGEANTPLTVAAKSGVCEIMEMFLKTEVETVVSQRGRGWIPTPRLVNLRNGQGETLLHIAVRKSDCAMVKLLLARGARINARDSELQTAIMLAIKSTDVEVVNILLEAGADLSPVCSRGNDALAHALHSMGWGDRHRKVFTAVITARLGARYTTPGIYYGLTEVQVHEYFINARQDQIPALAELGFNVDAKSRMGLTPLLVLSEHPDRHLIHHPRLLSISEQEILIAALLKAGADSNMADASGMTPLMKIASWSSAESCRLLLAHGARLEPIDSYGMTALAYAAWCGNCDNIDVMLPDKKSSNTVNESKHYHDLINQIVENDELEPPYSELAGKTPLMLTALHHERPFATEMLIKKGAEIDLRDSDGRTALVHAVRHNSIKVAAILVEHGASMITKDHEGLTLLMQAARTGSDKSVKWLLRQDVVDIDEISTSTRPYDSDTLTKETALTVAIRWGWSDIAATMVTFGASVETAFELDPGLLRYCDQEGESKSAALLRKHGGHLGWLE